MAPIAGGNTGTVSAPEQQQRPFGAGGRNGSAGERGQACVLFLLSDSSRKKRRSRSGRGAGDGGWSSGSDQAGKSIRRSGRGAATVRLSGFWVATAAAVAGGGGRR